MQITLKLQKPNQPVYSNLVLDTSSDYLLENLQEYLNLEYKHLDTQKLIISKLYLGIPANDYSRGAITTTIYLAELGLDGAYKPEDLHDVLVNILDVLDLDGIDPTLENYATHIENTDGLDFAEWQVFDENFFDLYFTDSYEAARATYFGHVNWSDDYVRFDGYGNLETTHAIDYVYEADEIMNQFLAENL